MNNERTLALPTIDAYVSGLKLKHTSGSSFDTEVTLTLRGERPFCKAEFTLRWNDALMLRPAPALGEGVKLSCFALGEQARFVNLYEGDPVG